MDGHEGQAIIILCMEIYIFSVIIPASLNVFISILLAWVDLVYFLYNIELQSFFDAAH